MFNYFITKAAQKYYKKKRVNKLSALLNKIYILQIQSKKNVCLYLENIYIHNNNRSTSPRTLQSRTVLPQKLQINKTLVLSHIQSVYKFKYIYPVFNFKKNSIINNGCVLFNLLRNTYLCDTCSSTKSYFFKKSLQIFTINKSPMAQRKRRGKEQYYSSFFIHNIEFKIYKNNTLRNNIPFKQTSNLTNSYETRLMPTLKLYNQKNLLSTP